MNSKIIIAIAIAASAILIFYLWTPESEKAKQYTACMNDPSLIAECRCIAGRDLNACDSIPEFGLWFKAGITKDRKYCDEILKTKPNFFEYPDCLTDTAETEEDCYAINYSKEPYEIQECLAYVHNDSSYCNEDMPEGDRKDCIANVNKNISLCYESPDFEIKWNCIMRLSSDESICEDYRKEFCTPLLK